MCDRDEILLKNVECSSVKELCLIYRMGGSEIQLLKHVDWSKMMHAKIT